MMPNKPMAFIDLKAQQKKIYGRILERIQTVLAHGQYILGPEVSELEERLASYVGVRHAITCSSGTDALLMVLLAKRVGKGDAIFTTPFTFIATAEVVKLLGATPVFVDIDPSTYNLNPEALKKALINFGNNPSARGLKPRGIIAVDLFGQPADYQRINTLAQEWGLFVLEDAAQSFGATYHGRRAGSLAEISATSFFPAKPLGGYGDGGAVFTDDDKIAAVLKSIRNHGQGVHRYDHERMGINGRLDTLQAAVLLIKLEIFDQEMVTRQEVAQRYTKGLRGLVTLPSVAPGCSSVWAQYSVQSEARANILSRLGEGGVPTAIYYPKPLHLQEVFRRLGYKPGDFPVSEAAAARIFSLPMHPYLAATEQERIIDIIREAVTENRRAKIP
jgi:UDP-2-acetamido-2-deoxy-ribo-hexuluronate aminotransferase